MKTAHRIGAVIAVLAAWGVAADFVHAQTTIHVEYLSLKHGDESTAAEAIKQTRQRAEQLFETDELYAWYRYEVRFPNGQDREFSDVIVSVYESPKLILPKEKSPLRHWIKRSEIFRPVKGGRSEGDGDGTDFTEVSVAILNDGGKRNKFLDLIKTKTKRDLKKRIRSNSLINWSLFELGSPDDEPKQSEWEHDKPRSYALIGRFSKFEHLKHSIIDKNLKPFLIKEYAWHLVDIIESPASTDSDRQIQKPAQDECSQ